MPYQKRNIAAETVCHVVNRGVDKRRIFLDDKDRLRFIHDLFEFNDTAPVNNIFYAFKKAIHPQSKVIARPYIVERTPRNFLVEILAFCLMPNHYHLLLKARSDAGVSKFMKKLNMGYARYFNGKYARTGALFQGRYRSVVVERETHLVYLPYYIHLNPLDLITPEWRHHEIRGIKKAQAFLDTYRWSSHLDYAGIKNFPSVTQRDFLQSYLGNPERYQKDLALWLRDLKKSADLSDVALE